MFEFFRNPAHLEKASIARSMQRAVSYVKGITVDVGCGDKPYLELFKRRVTQYVGLDLDLGNQKQLDVCADALFLPFKNGIVDTVVSNQTIEHIPSPEGFVKEIARVLKPGGTVVLTAPQLWCLHEIPHDYYRFTRYALDFLCSQHGLEVIILQERFGAFAAIGQMLSLMIYLPQSHRAWRIWLVRPLFGSVQLIFRLLDSVFYNPDLTLGYFLVAKKTA